MKLYLFPAGRAVGVLALKNHLGLDCEVQLLDFRRGDQLTPQYLALNPNKKMPTLEDDGFVLWESNAILFYMAAKHPEKGLWPSDLKGQADVIRWLAWESAHWDAEFMRHGLIRESLESRARPWSPRPRFHCARRAEFRPLRDRAQRLAGRQDQARWRAADDRGFCICSTRLKDGFPIQDSANSLIRVVSAS